VVVVVVMGSAAVDFVRSCTTVIIIGIVLTFVALAYLCWLLFALAVYALPFVAGVTAGLATYHSGSGPIGAIIVGAIASSITLIVGHRFHDPPLAPHSRSDRASPLDATRSACGRCAARSRNGAAAHLYARVSFPSPDEGGLLCGSFDIRHFSSVLWTGRARRPLMA
jgi:hypothetical protein